MKNPNVTKDNKEAREVLAEGFPFLPSLFFSILFFLAILFLSISAGSIGFSPAQTIRVLAYSLFGIGDVSNIPENTVTIILNIRLPRALLAAMVGSALSLSGAAMQG
ncbi:MAG TPA: iron chelate uptake ABC transporter family permease subunit, partial [Bacillota bacterium]|nr:iron chelate uptake ABC transporter family permease subunit [Bacillota bacterium]